MNVLITAWGHTKLHLPHSIQFSLIHLGAKLLTCLFSNLLKPSGKVPVFRLDTSPTVNSSPRRRLIFVKTSKSSFSIFPVLGTILISTRLLNASLIALIFASIMFWPFVLKLVLILSVINSLALGISSLSKTIISIILLILPRIPDAAAIRSASIVNTLIFLLLIIWVSSKLRRLLNSSSFLLVLTIIVPLGIIFLIILNFLKYSSLVTTIKLGVST